LTETDRRRKEKETKKNGSSEVGTWGERTVKSGERVIGFRRAPTTAAVAVKKSNKHEAHACSSVSDRL
jgi:hypothetical protein